MQGLTKGVIWSVAVLEYRPRSARVYRPPATWRPLSPPGPHGAARQWRAWPHRVTCASFIPVLYPSPWYTHLVRAPGSVLGTSCCERQKQMCSPPSGAGYLVGEADLYQMRKRKHSDKHHDRKGQNAMRAVTTGPNFMRARGGFQGRLPGGNEQKKIEWPVVSWGR